MKTWTVRLEVPMVAWALVSVEADTQVEAESKALETNTEGNVSYEYGGLDVRGAEVADAQEDS